MSMSARTYRTPMRADALTILAELAGDDRLVHVERIPGRPARHGELAAPLDHDVWWSYGLPILWAHQVEAIEHIRAGRSVVVATGTASGKSLCYQLPVAEAVTGPDRGTAICIFPTKALAQDQLRMITSAHVPRLVAATYDGDTGPEARTWVRRHANVVLTNPEMLHGAILPSHRRWANFLGRLRYVVVDELHTLRGIFGSHAAHVLRRLRRVCARYGSTPTFIFSSATIGDPARLASDLCGMPVVPVVDDASPRGERLFALWNPPLIDAASGARASTNVEVARLTAAFVDGGWRTVAFCRSRRATEVVANDVRRRVGLDHADAIRSYRAGYLPGERREIEADLFAGRLEGVVATNALELGIDVGGLDACILNGFPGTIASMWQQAGRAGRDERPSVAVLVAGADQLDQWLMAHPRQVFTRPPEPAVINRANPSVLVPQLACAAYEQPLTPDDEVWWVDDLAEGVRQLVVADRLRLREGAGYWKGRGTPAPGIGLRSGSPDEFRIEEIDGRLVGTVDSSRAFEQLHPGAIYLHLGQQYRVLSLELDERAAYVEPVAVDEYTQARSDMQVTILGCDDETVAGRAALSLGAVEIASQVVGYERHDARTRRVISRELLDLPPSRLVTRAFWYTVDDDVLDGARLSAGARPGPSLDVTAGVEGPNGLGVFRDAFHPALPGALHAAEHAAIGILPLFTICDRWDVGGVSTVRQAQTGRPTIVIYDGYPGGVGIAELGFAAGRRHLEATRAVIERCPCQRGCPSCVQSPKCGNGNEPLDKAAALALLRAILGNR
jgi:DEAD/DEAH box helicase domain-containing protein